MAEVPGTSSSTLNVTPVPHLAIAAWLHGIKLDQYESLLRNFHEVEDLLDLNTVDLLRLGIKNSAHRCRIIGSLRILREKDRRAPNCTKTNVSEAVTARTLFTRTTGDSTARGKDDSRQDAMSTLTRVGEETIEENYWYHGAIGRARAEALVLYSGDFLVRDSVSRLGDYVITCNWQGSPMHCAINRIVLEPKSVYEKTVYRIAKEQFPSVPALIRFYVGSKTPLTPESCCIISRPVNREGSLPTSPKEEINSKLASIFSVANNYANYIPIKQYSTVRGIDNVAIPEIPKSFFNRPLPEIPKEKPFTLSKQVILREAQQHLLSKWNSESALPVQDDAMNRSASLSSSSVDLYHCGSAAGRLKAPPKPFRVAVLHNKNKSPVVGRNKSGQFKEISGSTDHDDYHEYCDIDYEEALEDVHSTKFGVTPPPLPLRNELQRDSACVPDITIYDQPNPECRPCVFHEVPSQLQLNEYQSELFDADSKPLDSRLWPQVETALLTVDFSQLACQLTKQDFQLLQTDSVNDNPRKTLNGLLLFVLPQGTKLRSDVLERASCLRCFVAVSILHCASVDNRLKILAKWIQVANHMYHVVGNLYSFVSIMSALDSKQMIMAQSLWNRLRTTYTSLAVNYETQLRRIFRGEAGVGLPCHTISLPDLLPLAKLLEVNNVKCGALWDADDMDITYGIEKFWSLLEQSRFWCKLLKKWENNCDLMLRCGIEKLQPIVSEMCRTEFQLKLLWGSKGAAVNSEERYLKFDQLLDLMAERCEMQFATFS